MSLCSTSGKVLSYTEAVKSFNDVNVQQDIQEAAQKMTQAFLVLLEQFDAVSKHLHSLDLQGLTSPLKPRWDMIRKEFADLVWQIRSNAGIISGRLKIFVTMILPLVSQQPEGRLREEQLQVLQSFTSISGEQCGYTFALIDRASKTSGVLSTFYTEFAKFTSQRAQYGQTEIQDLCFKISELDSLVRHVCALSKEALNPGVTHIAFCTFRMLAYVGRKPGRSKISQQRLALKDCLVGIANGYDHVERKRNEVAHAQYTAQLRHSGADIITLTHNSVASLVSDEIMVLETSLGLFGAIWARLLGDCTEILHWHVIPNFDRCIGHLYSRSGNCATVWKTVAIFTPQLDRQ
ncbi:hypothetical protein BDQ17DRAFT_791867 [Cyathus striatus]|nr:hypothetical protein BDQ17DRAFT_791867 [Cyathus striatus]